MLKIASATRIPPFHVSFLEMATAANRLQAGRAPADPRVIHLEVGQPGTGAPAGAVRAVREALQGGVTMGYTEALGLPSLRHAIARHIQDWYGEAVPASRIAVTTGASGAFPLAFLAAFEPGDRVALAAPFYPPYVNILTALGMQPVILPASAAHRFQPSLELLNALDPPPHGLILASPCNPAGTMLHPDEFAAIAAWCTARGVRLISDEIYHGLTYGQPLSTAANVPGAIVINSFSKYFSMTGWRIGWMVLPEDLVRPVERLAQNLFISPPHISQIAAEAAFGCHAELESRVAAYARSRAHLLATLPEAGFGALSPAEGAFYLYADVADRTEDSLAFCLRMLAETGVAAAPGVDFDHARGQHFVRFSYCAAERDIVEASERLIAARLGGVF